MAVSFFFFSSHVLGAERLWLGPFHQLSKVFSAPDLLVCFSLVSVCLLLVSHTHYGLQLLSTFINLHFKWHFKCFHHSHFLQVFICFHPLHVGVTLEVIFYYSTDSSSSFKSSNEILTAYSTHTLTVFCLPLQQKFWPLLPLICLHFNCISPFTLQPFNLPLFIHNLHPLLSVFTDTFDWYFNCFRLSTSKVHVIFPSEGT